MHRLELKRIQKLVREIAPLWRMDFYTHHEDIEQLIRDTRNLAAEIANEDADHDLVKAADYLERLYWEEMADLK